MEYSIAALVRASAGSSIGLCALRAQAAEDGASEQSLRDDMARALEVMRASAESGLHSTQRSMSGMTGGQAALLADGASPLGADTLRRAIARALAIAEWNAAMGKIVAAPTAGASGILPAALLTAQEARGLSDEQVVDALFTAAAVGRVIADRASISGAAGGCQAECGSASAMAAAALCELLGGTPETAAHALAFALMNSLGLVCDPVGGLVEVPCVYRNAAGVANAFAAAEMALAGVTCPLPADEVIDAMRAVGDMLPPALRETGQGGCAACPSAKQLVCARPPRKDNERDVQRD